MALSPRVRPLLANTGSGSDCSSAVQSGNIRGHFSRAKSGRTLIEEGEDISTVQRLLGHRALTSTQIYTTPSARSLRAAVDALPPLPPGVQR